MNIGIHPLGARVLVQRLKIDETTTESGLIVPDQGVAPTYKNEVVAKGPDIKKSIDIGDIVITTPIVGDEVKHNQEIFYLVKEEDLLAVIERE